MVPRLRRRGRGDAGSATAEMAVALPALVVVLAGCLTALTAVSAQLRCVDAARLAARAAARGDPDASVTAAARQSAEGAAVTVRRDAGLVHVRVTLPVAPLPGGAAPLQVSAEVAAADEGR